MNKVDYLHTKWLSIDTIKHSNFTDQIFDHLMECYQQPHRKYHNLEHIIKLIELDDWARVCNDSKFCEFYPTSMKLCNQSDILLFFFFHDSIYETDETHTKNEWNSYLEFKKVKRPIYKGNRYWDIARSIKNSNHKKSVVEAYYHKWENYVLDCDLYILGSSPEEYNDYVLNICKEWEHIDELDYYKARKKILKKFLDNMTMTKYKYGIQAHQPLDCFPTAKAQAIINLNKEILEINQKLSL